MNPKLSTQSRKTLIKALSLVVFIGTLAIVGYTPEISESANLANVSVTLSNSRLSFRGLLDGAHTTGTSNVIIRTSGPPSISTNQLMVGDQVRIGASTSMGLYTVSEVTSNNTFNVDPVLLAGNVDDGHIVISTSSATLTVRLRTVNAINNGAFRILVPADPAAAGDASRDGIPDQGFFDYGTGTISVTCPANIPTLYTFAAGAPTSFNVTIGGTTYHSYLCSYTGTGGIGTDFDGITYDPIIINNVINPAPASGHVAGTADQYQILVQHLDSGGDVVDATAVAVGVIEAVRITAEVAPQISFSIAGINDGISTNTCGITTSVTTSPTAVPFGPLSIASFTHAAQTLSVSTNAFGGYGVTARASRPLGLLGGNCPTTSADCIPHSTANSMTDLVNGEWTNVADKGFGYSLNNIDATTITFQYNTSGGNCTGTYCARRFADMSTPEDPVEIFGSGTVAGNEEVNVCYKAIISESQAAGQYENYVTYTATATF